MKEYQQMIDQIMSDIGTDPFVVDIVERIFAGEYMSRNERYDKYVKQQLADVVIRYIERALANNYLDEDEILTIIQLKRLFKIKEGEIYDLCRMDVERLLRKQFELMLRDNAINYTEALHMVELQQAFGLSYNRFEKIFNDVKSVL